MFVCPFFFLSCTWLVQQLMVNIEQLIEPHSSSISLLAMLACLCAVLKYLRAHRMSAWRFHLEITFLIGLMSLQRWRPPTAKSFGINLNMQITRTPQTSQLRISGTNPKLSYVNNSLGNSEALQNAPWRTSVLPLLNLRFSLLVWWLKNPLVSSRIFWIDPDVILVPRDTACCH